MEYAISPVSVFQLPLTHMCPQKLALIRSGFGAAVLPANVRALRLKLAHRIDDGHMGARKFWREHLPRLQYHNPGLQVQVVREQIKGGPATLTVEFGNVPCKIMGEMRGREEENAKTELTLSSRRRPHGDN